jgi:hypothetical protein
MMNVITSATKVANKKFFVFLIFSSVPTAVIHAKTPTTANRVAIIRPKTSGWVLRNWFIS